MDSKTFLNVLLLGLIVAIATAQGGMGCVVLPNTDFPGNDINCSAGYTNINQCADKCYNTAGCLAFLWAVDDNPNQCCLKFAIDNTNRNSQDARLTVITGYGDCRSVFDSHQ